MSRKTPFSKIKFVVHSCIYEQRVLFWRMESFRDMTVSHTPQDFSIASTLLRSTVSVICAPFFIEAICSFASFIASNVSFFDIVFSYLLCFAAKVQLCFESAMLTGKKVICLCNKSVLSRYILYKV